MIEFLLSHTEPILMFLSGGGLSAFFTVKYTRKMAQADAMKAVQDVYQETIQDLRSDKEIIKNENLEMREHIASLEKTVKQNCADIHELKSYKCIVIDCKNRKTEKNMRKINKIILHCSATKENKNFTAKDIDNWHKQRGWNSIGYHYVILLDGTLQIGRPESEIGAHTVGQNTNSIGICYIGGLDINDEPKDTRTDQQKSTMKNLVSYLLKKYPDSTIHGHNEFANKACPCFNVKKEFKQ